MPAGGDWKELFGAAETGDLELLDYHLRQGIDPNYAHPEYLATPLVAAIMAGQIEAARMLLANGAQPELTSEADGMNPAQAAWRGGHTELARQIDPEGRWVPVPAAPQPVWRRLLPW